MLEKRPEVCPGFYKANLTPSIWRFVHRSEGERCIVLSLVVLLRGRFADHIVCTVYLFLLSLPPLWLAVALLRSAPDVRRRVEPGNPLPGSHTIARIALIAAVVVLIFTLIFTLQQFTKVARIRGEPLSPLRVRHGTQMKVR
jgi:hypothetical protein